MVSRSILRRALFSGNEAAIIEVGKTLSSVVSTSMVDVPLESYAEGAWEDPGTLS